MKDLDKVISALDCLAHGGGTYDCLKFPCPYEFYGYADCHKWEIARDALELLKEQEAVEPYQHDAVWLCGCCAKEVVGWTDDITGEDIRYPFCRQCGRSVKWG